MVNTSKRIGQIGEEIASRVITRQFKMKIIERNFRSRIGEIDIIALDKNTWVFIEVKTRAVLNAGFPEESVTEYKQDKIRKVALYYLMSQGYNPHHVNYRFDVMSITFTGDNYTHPSVKYFKNAF
ncbi:MAG: YraN family protein [Candidatus Atribacteria bacterium]|nr:YraN family protein [Candidatus Atribacteria bacterium]